MGLKIQQNFVKMKGDKKFKYMRLHKGFILHVEGKVRFSWLFALASRGKLISINSVDSPISRLITADHY